MHTATSSPLGEILLYESEEGKLALQVQLQNDTVWLTQAQMAELFGKERSVISKHISNVFKEQELDEKRNVQKMHIPFSDKPTTFYSLDTIISVGYRVKSKQGTQFRIWANRILKDYLIKGFATQEKLKLSQLENLKKTVALLANVIHNKELTAGEATNLLYFIIKNHSFTDGNKRIAALIFVWFLERNHILYKSDGSKRLADNALVALTLMIAESNPSEKDMMTKVVVSLINQNN